MALVQAGFSITGALLGVIGSSLAELLLGRWYLGEGMFIKQAPVTLPIQRYGALLFLSSICLMFSTVPASRVPRSGSPLRLGYMADFSWWPNRQNWSWLIEEVFPRVRRPLQIHVFGRGSERIAIREGVVRHGMVRDLAMVWSHADIMVCPTHVGAGVNIKLAESLHNRMPVLATTQAVGGLARVSGSGIVVIDDAADWAAFLDSPGAEQLADQMPSEELCEQFSVDQHSGALQRFVRDTMREAGSRLADTGSPSPTALSLLSVASVGSFNEPLAEGTERAYEARS